MNLSFKSQMVVELVLHEACMLAYVSEDFSFPDPGREAWIAVPFSVAKLAQTTSVRPFGRPEKKCPYLRNWLSQLGVRARN